MTIIEIFGAQSIILYQLYFTYSFLTYKNQYALIMVVTILTNIVINIAIKNYLMEWGKSHSYPVDMRARKCATSSLGSSFGSNSATLSGKSHSYPVDMRATLSGKSHSYSENQGKKHNHRLPLIGNLCRPIDKDCKNINTLGYGTPSNHSQISSFVAAFYYFYYRNTEEYSKTTTFILTALAIIIMATRYTSKMHSIPQIILGSLVGIFLAYGLNGIISFFI